MYDPREASVIYTPPSRRNLLHPTVGALRIVPTVEAAQFVDPPRDPSVPLFVVPTVGKTFAEKVPVVPEGEDDALKGAMLTAIRLITLDELPAASVLYAFAAGVIGWASALPDRRWRDIQRMSAS